MINSRSLTIRGSEVLLRAPDRFVRLMQSTSLTLSLAATLAALVSAHANPAPPEVVSSRELNGSPVVMDQSAPQRVFLDSQGKGRLELGGAEFLKPGELQTVRIPVRNISTWPAKVEVRTSFIKTDGTVVANPYAAVKGGFEGITRGFLGLISLGASEVSLDGHAEECTIMTSHMLDPQQEIIVEHQLPFACDQVVGSRSKVSLSETAGQNDHAKEIRRVLKEQYWRARDLYYQDRLTETRRWDEIRSALEKQRDALEPLSDAYRTALESYWAAHQGHQDRLASLEANFSRFVHDQDASLRAALGADRP